MQISVIASGSNGNSTLVEYKGVSVLIDAGISVAEMEKRLINLGKKLSGINALLLTHSHSDHSLSVGAISRKYNIPVYLTKEVHKHCENRIKEIKAVYFSSKKDFNIDAVTVVPVKTSHDVPSSGFVIGDFGIFTDTGFITDHMKDMITGLKGVLLESNYDENMLKNGPYSMELKKRIKSNNGHLSNLDSSNFINKSGSHLKLVLLGHISQMNNFPAIVKRTFEKTVIKKMNYFILSRYKESGVFRVS